MMRSIASLAAVGLAGVAANHSPYHGTTVSVGDVEIKECEGTPTCQMVFTARWDLGTVSPDLMGAPKLQWRTRGFGQIQGSEVLGSIWATKGIDYRESADPNNFSEFQTFSFGDHSTPDGREAHFTVTVMSDNVQEFSFEQFAVDVSPSFSGSPVPVWNEINIACSRSWPQGASTEGCWAALGIIEDSEGATLSIDDFSATENASTDRFVFSVHLSHSMDIPIYVNYNTVQIADGLGIARGGAQIGDGDFLAVPAESYQYLEIPANFNGVQEISIQVWDDDVQENLETFQIELTYPGQRLADGELETPKDTQLRPLTVTRNLAVGTFGQEDEDCHVSMDDEAHEEGYNGGKFVFTAKLSHPVDTAVRLTLSTSDGEASSAFGTPAVAPFVYTKRDPVMFAFQRLEREFPYTVNVVDDTIQTKFTHAEPKIPCADPTQCTEEERAQDTWGRRHFHVHYKLEEDVWIGNRGKSFWNVRVKEGDTTSIEDKATGYIWDHEGVEISINDVGIRQETDSFNFQVSVSHETSEGIPVKFRMVNLDRLPAVTYKDNEVQKVATYCETGQCPQAGYDLEFNTGYTLAGITTNADGTFTYGTGVQIVLATDRTPTLINLKSKDDNIAEPTEVFGVEILEDEFTGAGHWEATIVKNVGTGIIEDNDVLSYGVRQKDPLAKPYKKEISAADTADGADNPLTRFEFEVYLSHAVSEDFSLQFYTLSDVPFSSTANFAATAGVDYEAKDTTFTFSAGTTVPAAQGINVNTISDDIVEMDEWFAVVVSSVAQNNAAQYFVNSDFRVAANQDQRTYLSIKDDDVVDIEFCPSESKTCAPGSQFMFDESSQNFIYTATLTHEVASDLTIPWRAVAPNANLLPIANPIIDETTGVAKAGKGRPARGDGTDFLAATNINQQFTFNSGVAHATGLISLQIVNDNIQESNVWDEATNSGDFEYLEIRFNRDDSRPKGLVKGRDYLSQYGLGPSISLADFPSWVFHAYITDNEHATVFVDNIEAAEGNPLGFYFTAQLSHQMTDDIKIEWETQESTAKANDYVGKKADFIIRKNTREPATFGVSVTDDHIDEGTESFSVSLKSDQLYAHGGRFQDKNGVQPANDATTGMPTNFMVTGTILDNDHSVIAIADAMGDESKEELLFTVTLSHKQSDKGVDVDTKFMIDVKSHEGDTATANDFTAVETAERTIAKGTTAYVEKVTLTNDNLVEIAETFTATIQKPGAPFRGELGKAMAKGTIVDNEQATMALVANPPNTKAEAAGAELVFTATLTHMVDTYPNSPIAVTWSTMEVADTNKAYAGTDYEPHARTALPAVFANNAECASDICSQAFLTVKIIDDHIQESVAGQGEVFRVTAHSVNGMVTQAREVMGRITDDEKATISIPYTRGLLSKGLAEFPVVFSHQVAIGMRVTYMTEDITDPDDKSKAKACAAGITTGCDYKPLGRAFVNIDPNQKPGVVAKIPVELVKKPEGDTAIREIKRFKLKIIEIKALDGPNQSPSTNGDLKASRWNVGFMTTEQYVGTDKQVWDPTMADYSKWAMSQGQAFPCGNCFGYGEIYDDSGVKLVLSSVEPAEEGSEFVFTATLTHAMPLAVSVTASFKKCLPDDGCDYAADNNENPDYTTFTKTLSFKSAGDLIAAGESPFNLQQTVTVQTLDDEINEPQEGFLFYIVPTARTPASYFDKGTSRPPLVAIVNDVGKEEPEPREHSIVRILKTAEGTELTITGDAQDEGTALEFKASLSTGIANAFTCDVHIAHGDTNDHDFEGTPATVTFAADALPQTVTFTVPTMADTVLELHETFTVSLRPTADQVDNNNFADIKGLNLSDDSENVAHATGTIQNDDASEITIAAGATAAEGEDIHFDVSLSFGVWKDTTITFSSGVTGEDVTDAHAEDFEEFPKEYSLTFDAADEGATHQLAVSTKNDDIQEATETFQLEVTGVEPKEVGGLGLVATASITDQEEGVEIMISAGSGAEVADGFVSFTVATNTHISGAIKIGATLTFDGTATDADFNSGATYGVTFEPLAMTADLQIKMFNDNTQEDDETFTVTITIDAEQEAQFNLQNTLKTSTAVGTITDDEHVTADVKATDGNENDAGATIKFTASLSHAVDAAVVMDFNIEAGTATAGVDYETPATTQLTFSGAKAESHDVNVLILPDDLVEHQETVHMVFTKATSTGAITDKIRFGPEFETTVGIGKVIDVEDANLSVSQVNKADEAEDAHVSFTLTIDKALADDLSIFYTTSDSTASAETDYEAAENKEAVVPASATKGSSVTVNIDLKNDDIQEENTEEFKVSLRKGDKEDRIFAMDSGTICSIGDEEGATLKVNSPSGNEASGQFTFTVTLSHVFEADLTMIAATKSGSATGSEKADLTKDYVSVSKPLSFRAGSAAGTAFTVPVIIIDDNVQELDETFTLELQAINQLDNLDVENSNIVTTATLTDDKEAGAAIAIADAGATENEQIVSFPVTLTHMVSRDLVVNYMLGAAGDTADQMVNGFGDYSAQTVGDAIAQTATFKGMVAGPQVIQIPVSIKNDSIEETSETFTIKLTSYAPEMGDMDIERDEATGTIIENTPNTSERPVFSVASASADEGNAIEFTARLSTAGGFDVDFNVAWKVQFNGLASDDDIDNDSMQGTILLKAGETSKTFTIDTKEDDIVEPHEMFTVVLTAPTVERYPNLAGRFWTMGSNPTGTIIDDDTATITLGTATASETSGVLRFPVTTSKVVSQPFQFMYNTPVNIATKDFSKVAHSSDFEVALNEVYTHPADEMTNFLEVTLLNDAIQEDDETVNVQVIPNSLDRGLLHEGALSFSNTQTVGTITDFENCEVKVNTRPQQEQKDVAASVDIILTCQVNTQVSVDYAIHDASNPPRNYQGDVHFAQINTDYNLAANQETKGRVVFPANAADNGRAHSLHFILRNDDIQEHFEEQIMVMLSNTQVDSATLRPKIATVPQGALIIQDVENTKVTITSAEGPETSGEFTFQVGVNTVFAPPVIMKYTTKDGAPGLSGAASAGSDYLPTSKEIALGAGSMQHSIVVQVLNDDIVEADEAFSLVFTTNEDDAKRFEYVGGAGNGVSVARLVNDDEGGRFIVGGLESAEEGMGSLMLSVSLSHATDVDMDVNYNTVAGTATDGVDFFGVEGEFNFDAGEKGPKNLKVITIGNDNLFEDPETFSIVFDVDAPLRDIDASPVVVAIRDDEDAKLDVTVSRANEGGIFRVDVQLDMPADKPQAVNWAVRHVETVPGDFAPGATLNGKFTLSGSNGWASSFSIPTMDDTLVEVDEIFFIDFSGQNGKELFFDMPGDGALEVRIPNDDAASMTIRQKEGSGVEGEDLVAVFTLTGRTEAGFTMKLDITGGTATAGDDYVAPSTELQFAGNAGESHEVRIPTVRDGLVEKDETVRVSASLKEPRLSVALPGASTMTITNIDEAFVTVTSAGASEGEKLDFSVNLSSKVDVDVEVVYVIEPASRSSITEGHGAASNEDYTSIATNTVKFPAKSTRPVVVSVQTLEDNILELDEDLNLRAVKISPSREQDYNIDWGEGSSCADSRGVYCGVGAIRNDDDVTFLADGVRQVEEGQAAIFTITMSSAADAAVSVTVAAAAVDGGVTCQCRVEGSEDCGADLGCGDITVTIPAGSRSATVTFLTTNDNFVEGDESFSVVFQGASAGGREFGNDEGDVIGTGRITDNDSATVSIGSVTQSEADGKVEMAMVFTKRVDRPTTVSYTISAGATGTSATAADFPANSFNFAQTGSIPAYTLNGKLAIPVAVDGVAELDETFSVTVTGVSSAGRLLSMGAATATGTIEDSDAKNFKVTIVGQTSVGERSNSASFQIALSSYVSSPITVTVTSSQITATPFVDYNFQNTNKEFSAYTATSAVKTASVSVALNNDGITESTEQFTLRAQVVNMGDALSQRLSAAAGVAQLNVSILDNVETPDDAPVAGVEPEDVLEASEWKGKDFKVAAGAVHSYSVRMGAGFAQSCMSTNMGVGFMTGCDPVTADVYTMTVDFKAAGSTDLCIGAVSPQDGNENCMHVEVYAVPVAAAIPDQALLSGDSIDVELTVLGTHGDFEINAVSRNNAFDISFRGTTMKISASAAGASEVSLEVCDTLGCNPLPAFYVTVFARA